MKTLTITLHDTDNCGSSLQAFALQHFLLSQGIENEIINYVPDYVKNNGHGLKTCIRKLVFYKSSHARDKKFKEFVAGFLKLTPQKYYTYRELEKCPPEADCYITGSDQLWNSMYGCGRDAAFYLNFVKEKAKIAYAVSLGREAVPSDNLNIIEKYGKDFQWISVREKSSVPLLEKAFGHIKIEYVCDPVLLNSISTYDRIRTPRIFSEPYILIYMAQIPDAAFMEAFVEQVKKRIEAKVVLIGSFRNRCACDIHKRDVAPGDFLSLISNAEYVISNSFHATMFSLMYEKQFATVLPQENGARIKELLEYVGLVEHALGTSPKVVPWIQNDKYGDIRMKLQTFREESQQYLIDKLRIVNNG